MEARTDRRAPEAQRIPLDMLVRLTHEDYEEPFDADGVDVSAGGIALRADYLPEIGDRLRCRFDGLDDGAEIELDGEVVWAHDAGERSGEFGLRFAAMDAEAEAALSRTIAQLSGASGPPVERARLHLDSVATPIDAEVVRRDERSLTVEQELPFLRVGMGVAVEGRGPAHGKLASVDLRIESGVPRLLLVVEDAHPVEVEDDATLQDYELDRGDQRFAESLASMADEETPHVPIPSIVMRNARALHVPEEVVEDDEPLEPAEEEVAQLQRVERPETIEKPERAAPAARAALGSVLAERIEPAWAKVRERASALSTKARPALAALWTKIAALFAAVLSKGGPRAKTAWAKARSAAQALGSKAAARVSRGKGKRRTTAAPPTRTAPAPRLRRQREEPAARAPKKTARAVVLSALAFAGVGAAVYALTAGEPEPAPAPLIVPAPAPVAAAPVDSTVESTTLPIEPAPEAEAEAAAPAEPEGGQLGAPTYPTLHDTSATPSAAPAAPSAEPAPASAPVSEGTTFGAAEVSGQTKTIRMSQPVTTLRGERQSDGFTVTIPGSLALEGARGIAAANPAVDQSMILNRGDHSVLTVRFVAGQSPPYRVVARGAAIEVTIGR